MKYNEIFKMIKDEDGSCRDINFDLPTWEGIKNLLKRFMEDYSKCLCHYFHGNISEKEYNINELLELEWEKGDSAKLYLSEGKKELSQLQVFIYLEENMEPFIELTFFPRDVKFSEDKVNLFLDNISDIKEILNAKKFFLRYENASWDYGDVSKNAGIIYYA